MNKIFIAAALIFPLIGLYLYNANSLSNKPTQSLYQNGEIKMPENVANVNVTENGFEPQTITIKPGTQVIWRNISNSIATVNSDPYPVNNSYPPLNLGHFNNKQTVVLIFQKNGTYTYHNHLKPNQTGKVIVQ